MIYKDFWYLILFLKSSISNLLTFIRIFSTGDIAKNLIKTPILDKAYNLDLSPEFIFETLKYFVDCGERLTQMTKTYDDIDAVTKLLEEVSFFF